MDKTNVKTTSSFLKNQINLLVADSKTDSNRSLCVDKSLKVAGWHKEGIYRYWYCLSRPAVDTLPEPCSCCCALC